MWGIRYRRMSYGTGVYLEPELRPLADARTVADVHAHRWPSCEEFDYAAIARAVQQDDGFRPVHSGCYEPFLLYGYLRGLQTSMEDLALRRTLPMRSSATSLTFTLSTIAASLRRVAGGSTRPTWPKISARRTGR